MSVDTDVSASVDLLGKSITELQSNVSVGDDAITGELLYVDDYTGFSSKVEEQSGNYLVLHCESDEGATITVEVVGGTSGPVTLDPDGIIILLIRDTATQSVRVIATKDEVSTTKVYSLTGLTLAQGV